MGWIRKGSVIERKGKLYACVQFVDGANNKRAGADLVTEVGADDERFSEHL
jgi:hypothetical protein